MKLTYLSSRAKPSKELEALFDDLTVVEASFCDQEGQVPRIEDELKEKGIHPYDPDDFFLYTDEVSRLGGVISRNRLNSGMISSNGDLRMADTHIILNQAVRLPYSNDSEVLVVAPHYEEDYAMVSAMMHKEAGDSVYVLFCTLPPEKATDRSLQVYREVLGLKNDDFGFTDIPDLEVHKYRDGLRVKLKETIKRIKPKNIILPSMGSNFDHMNVLDVALPVCERTGANLIMGRSVQSLGLKPGEPFKPKLWYVMDGEKSDAMVSKLYSDDVFGSAQYVTQVANLSSQLPEPLVRYLSYLRESDSGIDLRAYGSQPLSINHEYRIPHNTRLFD
jgi:hypothetical protein